MEGIPESSCILYQNRDATVTLIDIPRSIELAQGDETTGRRLISSKPLEQPYPSVEPKSSKALSQVKPPSIKELLLYKHLQFALEEIKESQKGRPWCLPRIVGEAEERDQQGPLKRRKILEDEGYIEVEVSSSVRARKVLEERLAKEPLSLGKAPFARSNPEDKPVIISFGPEETIATLPPQTCLLYGSIEETLSIFEDTANRETRFNLIILDPPWPNRSALRKQSYELAHNANIKSLLSSLPLKSYLTPDGMIAVWVTNKSAFHDMLLFEDGLFEEWSVQLTEEWIWLKVTATGEPICSIESVWRKPYEVLLVGKVVSREKAGEVGSEVKRRVIVGVPDLHSRKPNLKELLKPMLPAKYEVMEIFARNLTAGWWAWGNEVLKFQATEHWTSP